MEGVKVHGSSPSLLILLQMPWVIYLHIYEMLDVFLELGSAEFSSVLMQIFFVHTAILMQFRPEM